MRVKWAPWQCSTYPGKMSAYSHPLNLPYRRNHGLRRSHLALSCAVLGKWVTWVKSNCCSYLLQGIQTNIFSSNTLLVLLCWKSGLCKSSQVCGLLFKMVLSRSSWTVVRWAGASLQATAGSTAKTEGCMLITWCAGVQDYSWSLGIYY